MKSELNDMTKKMMHLLFGLAACTAGAGTVARMEPYHGAPAIMVNGEAVPPMTVTLLSRGIQGEARAAYMKKLGEAGIKVYYVTCATRCCSRVTRRRACRTA